jgi:hypothetical protein
MRLIIILVALFFLVYTSHSQDFVRTVILNKTTYKVYNDDTSLIVTRGKVDTVINIRGEYFTTDFQDINSDGYVDILGNLSGNTHERYDLFLFVPKSRTFRKVNSFEQFPAPIKLSGTKYYYSYHKSGCADMNWDSDLFYISNYKAIRVGNINGRQCYTNDEAQGVFIYKVSLGKEKLVKSLKSEVTSNYQEGKWGFIKEYWTKNWRNFVQ